MPDRNNAIRMLCIERECVSRDCDRDCGKCDLAQDREWLLKAYDEALELLKEQEPVPPIPYQQDTSIGFFTGFKCGVCNAVVFPDYRFCPMCGKAVKWDA